MFFYSYLEAGDDDDIFGGDDYDEEDEEMEPEDNTETAPHSGNQSHGQSQIDVNRAETQSVSDICVSVRDFKQ